MSDEIKVSCRTNLDGFTNVEWPTSLLCRPLVGDNVEGHRGQSGACRPRLRVVAVTHCTRGDGVPYLEVELHR